MNSIMKGAVLPGNSTVELKDYPVPDPGKGQVLIKMKASTICGSDIRAIYREHIGKGPEAYQGVIAGHEPCGQIVKIGSGVNKFKKGDRVILYHIAGCGVCHDCRMGYLVSCSSPKRAAYGWQRDGGMADYLLAEENTCVLMPDELSYIDGANVACGFGTSYEACRRVNVSGYDNVLVVGLGPVGLATLMLCRALGAKKLIGIDIVDERLDLADNLNLADTLIKSDDNVLKKIYQNTGDRGCEVSIDCSASPQGRLTALHGTRQWGRVAFVGEGNNVTFEPSRDIIHKQITIYGSWVTSIGNMEDLVERLVRWNLKPEKIVTHKFHLQRVSEAYDIMDKGKCGKVAVVFD